MIVPKPEELHEGALMQHPTSNCARCESAENCSVVTVFQIVLCDDCVNRIIGEWKIKWDEFDVLRRA